jgi:hypothetical protein
MMEGIEVRLYDPRRDPAQWTEIVLPAQCAVMLKDVATSAPLSRAGKPFGSSAEATCTVFDSLHAAQEFCEAIVAENPGIRCEIFGREGLAHPPLVVILHPSQQRHDESGTFWARRRRLIAIVLFAGALPLFWLEWHRGGSSFLPTFFGINMTVAALRFAYWDFGLRHRERERQKRLEVHRRHEDA